MNLEILLFLGRLGCQGSTTEKFCNYAKVSSSDGSFFMFSWVKQL